MAPSAFLSTSSLGGAVSTMLKKTNPFHAEHAHHDEAVHEMLIIFSQGVAVTKGRSLALAGCALAAFSPFGILIALPFNVPRLAAVALLWWVITLTLELPPSAEIALLIAGMSAVLFKDLAAFFSEAAMGLVIAVTGGRIVKTVCAGYLQRNPFAQSVLESNRNAHTVTVLAAVIDRTHRRRYDELLGMYLASVTKDGEEALIHRLRKGVDDPVLEGGHVRSSTSLPKGL